MNENINLGEILKNCPEGWILFSPLLGFVRFLKQTDSLIWVSVGEYNSYTFYKNGHYDSFDDSECLLFPSKEQRDWSKFTAPWYIKEKFDPKTLQPFDKVLVRDIKTTNWKCKFFSHISESANNYFVCTDSIWKHCIPYNDDTKRLVGTKNDAPEYYCYWEE